MKRILMMFVISASLTLAGLAFAQAKAPVSPAPDAPAVKDAPPEKIEKVAPPAKTEQPLKIDKLEKPARTNRGSCADKKGKEKAACCKKPDKKGCE